MNEKNKVLVLGFIDQAEQMMAEGRIRAWEIRSVPMYDVAVVGAGGTRFAGVAATLVEAIANLDTQLNDDDFSRFFARARKSV